MISGHFFFFATFAEFLLLDQEVTILRFVRELVCLQPTLDMCLTWYVVSPSTQHHFKDQNQFLQQLSEFANADLLTVFVSESLDHENNVTCNASPFCQTRFGTFASSLLRI